MSLTGGRGRRRETAEKEERCLPRLPLSAEGVINMEEVKISQKTDYTRAWSTFCPVKIDLTREHTFLEKIKFLELQTV